MDIVSLVELVPGGWHTLASAALVALALAIVAILSLGWVRQARDAREARFDLKRLHQQQATIVGMLLRAGFRPPSGRKDWFEDPHATKDMSDIDFTKFDWRKPS